MTPALASQAPATAPLPATASLRDRHHNRAQAVARGEALEGPLAHIFLTDPAFLNLVAYYQRTSL